MSIKKDKLQVFYHVLNGKHRPCIEKRHYDRLLRKIKDLQITVDNMSSLALKYSFELKHIKDNDPKHRG